MIRVVYRWRVDPLRQSEFAGWWHEGTLRIRQSNPGALGSTLCRSTDDPELLIGIARWQSRAQLEGFWERTGPVDFSGATMQSIEVLEELDDLTIGPGGELR